jgi:hypothetical protein
MMTAIFDKQPADRSIRSTEDILREAEALSREVAALLQGLQKPAP